MSLDHVYLCNKHIFARTINGFYVSALLGVTQVMQVVVLGDRANHGIDAEN